MPRKTKGGKPVDATGTVLKAIRLELPLESHKQLRIEAARQDMSMAAYVRHLVEEHLTGLGTVQAPKEGGGAKGR